MKMREHQISSNDKATILIVGSAMSTLTNYLLEHGYEYIVLRDILICKDPKKNVTRRVVCDFSSEEKLFETVRMISKKHTFAGVMAIYENYIISASKIAHFLDLPALPLDAAEACTDKLMMREKFSLVKEKISPAFALINQEADLLAFADSHAFPLVLKPANLSASMLVTKNCNKDELLKNYEKTCQRIQAIYEKQAPGRSPRLIIEEFLQGSIHSVDAFVDGQGTPHVLKQVIDCKTGYDIGIDDNFHYSNALPSLLSENEIEQIRHVAALGCKALGMKNAPAHIELALTEAGPRLLEIAARNGGYRSRMHCLANGLDLIGAAINTILGRFTPLKASKNEPCVVLELYPKKPGIFKCIQNEKKIRSLPSLYYYKIQQPIGEYTGKASDGFKGCAIIILHHHDMLQIQRDIDYIKQHVNALTAPLSGAKR
jgi:biotin carboxylase